MAPRSWVAKSVISTFASAFMNLTLNIDIFFKTSPLKEKN